ASCVCWGFGFTWAKAGGTGVNHYANAGDGSPFGPILLLAFRFLLAGAVWVIIFPKSRRGWTLVGLVRSVFLVLMLATGLVVQHLGLDRTDESVSAFLTSLTVLFVPVIVTIVLRKKTKATLWFGVILAAIGVWMLTAARTQLGDAGAKRFGLGE